MTGVPMNGRYLEAGEVKLRRDAFDRLRLKLGPDETHEGVKVARAFPTSARDSYISLQTDEGKEIGMLESLSGLEEQSRRVLTDVLSLLYPVPTIEVIRSVQSQHGTTTWVVRTDHGETTILVKDRGDIRRLGGGRVLFSDVNGMKYEIPDYHRLDDRGQALLQNEI